MELKPEGAAVKYLLPHYFQKIGLFLILAGMVSTYLRFGMGIKPDFLEIKVFAVYSSYFQTRYFSVIGNNISEEICGILLLAGLFFITLAREKNELSHYEVLRLRSFILAAYSSSIFILLSFFFIFGLGFVAVLSLNIILPLVFYNIFFRFFLYKSRHSSPP